jgi:hypothetical protein
VQTLLERHPQGLRDDLLAPLGDQLHVRTCVQDEGELQHGPVQDLLVHLPDQRLGLAAVRQPFPEDFFRRGPRPRFGSRVVDRQLEGRHRRRAVVRGAEGDRAPHRRVGVLRKGTAEVKEPALFGGHPALCVRRAGDRSGRTLLPDPFAFRGQQGRRVDAAVFVDRGEARRQGRGTFAAAVPEGDPETSGPRFRRGSEDLIAGAEGGVGLERQLGEAARRDADDGDRRRTFGRPRDPPQFASDGGEPKGREIGALQSGAVGEGRFGEEPNERFGGPRFDQVQEGGLLGVRLALDFAVACPHLDALVQLAFLNGEPLNRPAWVFQRFR